jgi:glycosyltransferase involved in cell wall biosynthesis
LRRATRVVCPTQATARDAVRLARVDPRRISVVPYGVGDQFRPLGEPRRSDVRASLAREGIEHLVLHVSTGDPYKNVEGTLRVVAALRASGMRAGLIRAGAPLRATQRQLARRLGLEDVIIDCGRVSDERLVELYNAADVLLFPSHHEGYGWPPLEAMSCGTPVVTSTCAALTEVCGDAALAAPAIDVPGLMRAIRDILTSREIAETLRKRGFERAAGYPWSRTVDGFAQTYDDVAGLAARRALPCAA